MTHALTGSPPVSRTKTWRPEPSEGQETGTGTGTGTESQRAEEGRIEVINRYAKVNKGPTFIFGADFAGRQIRLALESMATNISMKYNGKRYIGHQMSYSGH